METIDCKENVCASLTLNTKVNGEKKCDGKGKVIAGEFKAPCEAEGIQIYSTKSETEAAFAERTIRFLKNIIFRCMENFRYKYIHKLSPFIKTLTSGKTPDRLHTKECQKVQHSVHSVQQATRTMWKTKAKIGNRIRISKSDSPFRNAYKQQPTPKVLENVANYIGKPPTNTIKDKQFNFIRKIWSI